MAFSNFTPLVPFELHQEEYVDIKVQNAVAADVFITCNGFCHKMYVDKQVPNGFKIRWFGWMGGYGNDLDLTLVGTNGDVYTKASMATLTLPSAPILPILEYILDYCKTHPILGQKSFSKVYKLVRKPYKHITTRPQILATCADGDIDKPHIGSVASEWDESIEIIYIADIRKKADLENHEKFLQILETWLSANPNLDNRVGLVEIDPTGFNLPDERLENIYLHQSTVRCTAKVIPLYADQIP